MNKIVPMLFLLLFLPPVYIVVRYLSWCCKEQAREEAAEQE